jgi:Transposase DDE domain group 1
MIALLRTKKAKEGLSMETKFNSTEVNAQAYLKLKGQKLLNIDDGGGLLSGLGGLPLMSRLVEDTGMAEKVAGKIPEWRNEEFITFSKEELLTQRLYLAASGNSDAIDCSLWRDDPALKSVLSKAPDGLALASQSTHTRLEQAIDETTVKELEGFFLDFFFDQHKQAPRKLAVAIDGSGIQTYGAQQGSTYRGGKKAQEQYFPLVATTDSGWLLLSQLRYGRVSDANALPIIKDLVVRIKSKWPNTVLTLRIDTGFNSPELLDFLDKEGIGYECGYPCTDGVRAMCEDVFAEVEKEFLHLHGSPKFVGAKGKEKFQREHNRIRDLPAEKRMEAEKKLDKRRVRKVVEIMYRGSSWDKERRVIVRADFSDSGLDVRSVVTSHKYGLPKTIYEDGYCKRARVEMFIKENKSQCRVPLSCQEYTSNQFRFVLQGLAYQLLHMLRLKQSAAQANISVAGIRNTLLLVPVLIIPTPRRLYWHLSSVHPNTAMVIQMAKKMQKAA